MNYLLDFRDGPLGGQTMVLERHPASLTIAFNDGPCVMYVAGKITKRLDNGMHVVMAEADYEKGEGAGPKRGKVWPGQGEEGEEWF